MQYNYAYETATGYQQISDLSSAVTLTVPPGTDFCIIVAETQAVRWRDDDVAPTNSTGQPLLANVPMKYTSKQIRKLQFIEQKPSAKLNVTYYGHNQL